jgi:hypothetical protein
VLAAPEPAADRVANAAARTLGTGTARLFAAWCTGSPVPEAADRRCEGMADLTARRALVSQALMFTDGLTERFAADRMEDAGDAEELESMQPRENVYDGANMYIRVGSRWTGFSLTDPAGPRGPNDPLWPLDALSGANQDVTEVGPDTVRGEAATRYRLTVDLGRADASLTAGVSVPSGPYRSLSQLPAEVWLDSAGRALRIAVLSDPTAPADTRIWSVTELWDFGVPVDIAPPDPAEVLSPAKAYRTAYPDPEPGQ